MSDLLKDLARLGSLHVEPRGETPRMRPFGIIDAIRYAVMAAVAHYRFARTHYMEDAFPEGISLVVSSRAPTDWEMDTVGIRWSDYARMQGIQPVDPATTFSDIAILWREIGSLRTPRKQTDVR